MIHKKRIITQLIASIILIGVAVIIQIFVKPENATFMVAIILGIATGVIVAMVDCLQKNKSELDTKVLTFERIVCRVLSCIKNISELDVYGDKIVNIVEMNLDKIYDYCQEMEKLIDELNLLLVLPCKEKKIKKIIDDIGKVSSFINCNYNFSSTIKRLNISDGEFVSKMEALKAIKFMRKFNPEPILDYLQHSKNNQMKPNFGDKECFFNIIFEQDVFSESRRNAGDEMIKNELEATSKRYANFDLLNIEDTINKMPQQEWNFSTATKKRYLKKMNKEKYYD